MSDYDVIVIGAGPGGYEAAIRCAQLGMKTACIDDQLDEQGQPSLGGVCLNIGCIPSKALLDSSHHYHRAQHEFANHGINTGKVSIDVATMMQRKQQVVQTLTGGIAMLFTKYKIDWLPGRGQLVGEHRVRVDGHGDKEHQEITVDNIIIATGSSVVELELAPFDHERIVDSTGALSFTEVPARLGIIGGGVVGLELGSVWSRLGSKTTMLIRSETFMSHADRDIAAALQQDISATENLDLQLGAQLKSVKKTRKQITVNWGNAEGEHTLQLDKLLIAAGRYPNSVNIGAETVGLGLDARGFIEVDAECRTNLPGVFAIGDVVRGMMLAHKASAEGVAVAERLAGQQPVLNYKTIPLVIYTWPEVAWVGLNAEQLQADGIEFKAGVFPLIANGRAHAAGETSGLVKILSDARTDTILGVHIYGANASELIAEAVLAMEFTASAEDLARTIHAHPTFSEAIHEAALAVGGQSLHI
ncbi:Dihydrolipoamide dehydrogenase of 2-oxoglutarate dehydrogenase [hydrothermal vent metagenome]|uniref:Dihydrolipoyl dehydrogenase n=1 Tax=hydrothermal vent metagenome TaxID=652676 RepID=A0A3B1B3M4_9ZZZZ